MATPDAGSVDGTDAATDSSDALDAAAADGGVDPAIQPDDAQVDPGDASLDANPVTELTNPCGFRREPAKAEMILSTGGLGTVSNVARAQQRAWLRADRAVSHTLARAPALNAYALSRAGYQLWEASSGLQLKRADYEEPVDVAADAFLTYEVPFDDAGNRLENAETFRLRSLADGSLIGSYPTPGAFGLSAVQGGVAVDASYVWVRSGAFLRVFSRTGTPLLEQADNHTRSLYYGASDSLWVGRGPSAPEVVRIPLDGGAVTITTGVVGEFQSWSDDGLHFFTLAPGSLVRVYRRDGTRILGQFADCYAPYYAVGNTLACWSGITSLKLYDLANPAAPVDAWGNSSLIGIAQRNTNGYWVDLPAPNNQTERHRISFEQGAIHVTPDAASTLDELLDDSGLAPRIRKDGAVRTLGCGFVTKVDGADNGLVSVSTSIGTFLYDVHGAAFTRFLPHSPLVTGSLSRAGDRLGIGTHVYQVAPSFLDLGDFSAGPGTTGTINDTGTFIGRQLNSDTSPLLWDVVKVPEGTVVASGSLSGPGAIVGPVVSPTGASIAVSTVFFNYKAPMLIYRNGIVSGSNTLVPTVWLTDDVLFASANLLNTEGTTLPAPRCSTADPDALVDALQVLSETSYYGGAICSTAGGADPLPVVRERFGHYPQALSAEVGVYSGPSTGNSRDRLILLPWRQ